MPEETKHKTKKELLEADPDTLTTDELIRRKTLIELESQIHNLELTRHQNAEFQMKAQEKRDKFYSRGRELRKTEADQKKQQENCSHRKGGRGLEAIMKGGNAPDFAFIKHLLPWNEWYIRCQRCGKTWKPAHAEDYDLRTKEGKEAFEKAKADYKWAMDAPTDNIPSTGITFQYDDDGKFAHEVTKEVNLR